MSGAVQTPSVRVVVLNWNRSDLTTNCVRSLLATDHPAEAFEVVIVDNGSVDDSAIVLRSRFPVVRIVENGVNLGFAEGCNRAMRDLDGIDLVALVNNDSIVEPGWLRPLVAAMADPSVGAACPKVLFLDDSDPPRVNSCGIELTELGEGRERRLGEIDDGDSGPSLVEVEAFSGAAVLIRSTALAAAGLFDPSYFAYSEDLELSWRMRRLGWRIVCVPEAVTRHLRHGSGSPTSSFFRFVDTRNWLVTTLRHAPRQTVFAALQFAVGRTSASLRGKTEPTWSKATTSGGWARVWASVFAALPSIVAQRLRPVPLGLERADRVGSRWMPAPRLPTR